MAQELKELIEKIQTEGVKAAEDKAREIEKEARQSANKIIKDAQKKAEQIIGDAKTRIEGMEASGRSSLKQAGRDLILSLRKEINAVLDRLVVSRVHKALSPDELISIIGQLVKNCKAADRADIVISLKKEDLEKIEKQFLSELKDEAGKGITLRRQDEIQGGFTISFDKGKSLYDFTDKALAEYISSSLNPKLAQLLK